MSPVLRFLLLLSMVATMNSAAQSAEPTTVSIRVMTFNILQGGADAGNVGFGNQLFDGSRIDDIAAVIRFAQADVVGVQEDCATDDLLQTLGTGWVRVGSVYSRMPVEKISQAPYLTVVRVTFPEGRAATVVNCHWLPPRGGYGPDLVQQALRSPQSLEAPAQLASRVVEQCAVPNGPRGYLATLAPIRAALQARESVILTGDFNEPSHLDWTDRYAREGADRWVGNPTGTPLRQAIPWPGSTALAELGMKDAYRHIYSDEVKHPGVTWTPPYPAGTPGRRPYAEQCLDRIDRILVGGSGFRITRAAVVGEADSKAELIYPGRWPSDHRAVVVSLE